MSLKAHKIEIQFPIKLGYLQLIITFNKKK